MWYGQMYILLRSFLAVVIHFTVYTDYWKVIRLGKRDQNVILVTQARHDEGQRVSWEFAVRGRKMSVLVHSVSYNKNTID